MINVILLGTSCMVPTKERNVVSIYLEFDGEGLLFDCGEGTQRQMNTASIPRTRVKKLFISHWHGDHVSGIIGLLQTISNSQTNIPLEVFGPKETKKRFAYLLNSAYFGNINLLNLQIHEININNLTKIYENEKYYIEAIPLDHGVPCLGYNFIEKDRLRIKVSQTNKLGIPQGPLLGKLQKSKDITFQGKKYHWRDLTYTVKGKKVSIIFDTIYTKNALTLAKDADLLISEATYLDKHLEKGDQYKHLTVKQAALIANNSNAKKLIMVHFSQRYTDMTELEEEAKTVFANSYIGYDLMKIKL